MAMGYWLVALIRAVAMTQRGEYDTFSLAACPFAWLRASSEFVEGITDLAYR